MRSLVLLVLLALAVAILAQESRTYLERDDAIPIPAGWRRTTQFSVAQSSRRVRLTFHLKQQNLDVLEETFWAVSDPQNPRYKQYMTQAEVSALVAPTQEAVTTVLNWLHEQGCTDVNPSTHGSFIVVHASVPLVAKLLDINFHTYRHSTGLSMDLSVGPYSLPSTVANHVTFVSGAVGFPDIHKPRARVNPAPPSGLEIIPTIIRARYNVSDSLVCTNPNSSHAVAEFQAQYYSEADLKTFFTKYVPFFPYKPINKIIGTNDPSDPQLEASLDTQYLMGVAPNATTWFYSRAQFNFWSDLTYWTNELLNETTIPWVHSISYGEQGNYPTDAYRDQLNTNFQQIGVRGASIIFASGDSGAGCEGIGMDEDIGCDCTFFPSFPATCPYVTTIGATKFLNGNSGPEGAVVAFKSGGGFSQLFPIPRYQATAVASYLSSGVSMPESCAFNSSGRSTPDASALGDEHFQVVNGGRTVSVGGTSASAPTFAAIITLLNDQLFNSGSKSLGFLNQWIYQTARINKAAFFDVTVGDNSRTGCCRSGLLSGFDCAVGYDPVTGVGTPNFAELSKIV